MLAHDNAMKQVVQAGAKPLRSFSVTLEWHRDWERGFQSFAGALKKRESGGRTGRPEAMASVPSGAVDGAAGCRPMQPDAA